MRINREDQKTEVLRNRFGGNGEFTMRHFMTEEEACGAGRIFSVATFPPGASIGYHRHEGEYEIYLTVSGEATIVDDGETYTLKEGDSMVCRNGHSHSIENRTDRELEMVFIILFDQSDSFRKLAAARYSVRKYSDRPVEKEKMDAILEAGRLAPTAKNNQAVRIYMIKSPEAIAQMDEITPCRYGAPIVLMFAYDSDNFYTYEDRNSGDQDCAIVATHIMLEAKKQGIGTLWVDNFSPSRAKTVFGLPENEQPVLVMPLGYEAEGSKPSRLHEQSKTIEEMVTEL